MRLGLSLALSLAFAASALAGEDAPYRLIVNAANPTEEITPVDLVNLFLHPSARWKHGPPAAPVDQSFYSPVRAAFSREILGQSVSENRRHWEQQLRLLREPPPPAKGSDADVIAYVEKQKGGVGYVSTDVPLPATVKVLRLRSP